VGNTIWILLAWRPNWFLSKHFFGMQVGNDKGKDKSEVEAYGYWRSVVSDEYREKTTAMEQVALDFWRTVHVNEYSLETKELLHVVDQHVNQQVDQHAIKDDAGVMLDGMQLYKLFTQGKNNGKVQIQWNAIPKQQLIQIAISQGMSSTLSAILPRRLLLARLRSKIKDVVLDDACLLQEGHQHQHHLVNSNGNLRLTDGEVLDACAFRGIKCDLNQSYEGMRISLANYLKIMEPVHKALGKERLVKEEEGIMFVLHLQPVRFHLLWSKATSKRNGNGHERGRGRKG
jgi:hypothetical protein